MPMIKATEEIKDDLFSESAVRYADLSKLLLSLSTGACVFLAAFEHDFVTSTSKGVYLVDAAWIFFFISSISGILHQFSWCLNPVIRWNRRRPGTNPNSYIIPGDGSIFEHIFFWALSSTLILGILCLGAYKIVARLVI
jgi:hypothetical protein